MVDDRDDGERRDARTVGGILLAAGHSTRFGEENKLLARLDGKPLVRQAARPLLSAELDSVVAVLGHQARAVREALGGLDVDTRFNPDHAEGQSTSVRTGVAAARERGWDAAVFGLGDMPSVDPSSIDALVSVYREGDGTALAPAYERVRGNPVLFDQRYFDALSSVRGDRGGREILERAGTLVTVDDPGVRTDIDRRSDLDDSG
jgi:molybdenum cofactor cytidylyltransferase